MCRVVPGAGLHVGVFCFWLVLNMILKANMMAIGQYGDDNGPGGGDDKKNYVGNENDSGGDQRQDDNDDNIS